MQTNSIAHLSKIDGYIQHLSLIQIFVETKNPCIRFDLIVSELARLASMVWQESFIICVIAFNGVTPLLSCILSVLVLDSG